MARGNYASSCPASHRDHLCGFKIFVVIRFQNFCSDSASKFKFKFLRVKLRSNSALNPLKFRSDSAQNLLKRHSYSAQNSAHILLRFRSNYAKIPLTFHSNSAHIWLAFGSNSTQIPLKFHFQMPFKLCPNLFHMKPGLAILDKYRTWVIMKLMIMNKMQ